MILDPNSRLFSRACHADERRKALNTWLAACSTSDLYEMAVRNRLAGTCEWILHAPEFQAWASNDFPTKTAKFLWVHGPPGYGKTTLCTNIIDYGSDHFSCPFAYYFFSADSETRSDPFAALRSWVAQIVAREPEAFRTACDRCECSDADTATRTDILDILKAITRQVPHCTLIMDGLDECAWTSQGLFPCDGLQSAAGFLGSIKQVVSGTTTRVAMLSREEPHIRHAFASAFEQNGQSATEYSISSKDVRADAMIFSRNIVDKKLANKPAAQRSDLSQKMVERCDGMFLWMKFLGNDLRGGMNTKKLHNVVEQAPAQIERLYDRNWARMLSMPDCDKNRALQILRWAAFAIRPLTIIEITEALLIVDDDRHDDILVDDLPDCIDEEYVRSEILDLCHSLLEIRKLHQTDSVGLMTVHVAHFSVKQYILSNLFSLPSVHLSASGQVGHINEMAHSNFLAKLCLRYLHLGNIWQGGLRVGTEDLPRAFLEYATRYWADHLKPIGPNYSEVVPLVNAFFSLNNANWESWRVMRLFDSCGPSAQSIEGDDTARNRLFYAALLGLDQTVDYLLGEVEVDSLDKSADCFRDKALQGACLSGHTTMVRRLVKGGTGMKTGGTAAWTHLLSAAASGRPEIFRLLAKNDVAATPTEDEYGALIYGSSMMSLKVFRQFLETGANITASTGYGWTPLGVASASGHVEVVRLLLSNEDNYAKLCGIGYPPLHLASYYGQVEVVKVLLEYGLICSAVDSEGWTPLNLAASNGHVGVVKVLQQHGADPTIPTNMGLTPLHSAIAHDHIDVARVLLEMGSDGRESDQTRSQVLKWAASNGKTAAVGLLLEHGADVSGRNGWTALRSAAFNGHLDLSALLLAHGAPVETNNGGWSPLSSAMSNGHFALSKLLIHHGADITVVDRRGQTPLHEATSNGNSDMVRLLLERGASPSVEDEKGWAPLHFASSAGNMDVLRLLLEHGADISGGDGQWTPLDVAASIGNIQIASFLVDKGAPVTTVDRYGWSPLTRAIFGGLAEMVSLFLDKGVDPETSCAFGRTSLHYAVQYGQVDVVELLLSRKANIHVRDRYGSTPLMMAAASNHLKVAKLLLDAGDADLEAPDLFGRTALSWATEGGYSDMVTLFHEILHTGDKNRGPSQASDASTVIAIQAPKQAPGLVSDACDVCTRSIMDKSVHYKCGECLDGDFDMCSECRALGACCSKDSHTLIELRG